jgi:hypothetical protein
MPSKEYYRYGTRTLDPKKYVTRTVTFTCHFPDGNCKYKKPANLYTCTGCYYSTVVKQSAPTIEAIK